MNHRPGCGDAATRGEKTKGGSRAFRRAGRCPVDEGGDTPAWTVSQAAGLLDSCHSSAGREKSPWPAVKPCGLTGLGYREGAWSMKIPVPLEPTTIQLQPPPSARPALLARQAVGRCVGHASRPPSDFAAPAPPVPSHLCAVCATRLRISLPLLSPQVSRWSQRLCAVSPRKRHSFHSVKSALVLTSVSHDDPPPLSTPSPAPILSSASAAHAQNAVSRQRVIPNAASLYHHHVARLSR